jgi:hypothetical protein
MLGSQFHGRIEHKHRAACRMQLRQPQIGLYGAVHQHKDAVADPFNLVCTG